jgi:phage-related protein
VAYARKHLLRVSVRPADDRVSFRILDRSGEVLDEFVCSKESYPRIASGREIDRRPSTRWRFYETPSGSKPVLDAIMALADRERARVKSAMNFVRENGLKAGKRLKNQPVHQISVETGTKSLRIIFSPEGKHGHVLLALYIYDKNTDHTPQQALKIALDRLAEWRRRGEEMSLSALEVGRRASTLKRAQAR